MSAYVVDRDHIAALIRGAMTRREYSGGLSWIFFPHADGTTYHRRELPIGDYDRASEVAQMLWDENVKSVRHRYPECTDGLPGTIDDGDGGYQYGEHMPSMRTLEPVAILKACDGYEYQACEHDGWQHSEAHAFIEALRHTMIHQLPGYEDAAWEVTS